MRRFAAVFGIMAWVAPTVAYAVTDPYHVTDQEKAACTEDAVRFCMDTYPNEQRLLECMKRNRASLSPTCLTAFDAGVRRRHL